MNKEFELTDVLVSPLIYENIKVVSNMLSGDKVDYQFLIDNIDFKTLGSNSYTDLAIFAFNRNLIGDRSKIYTLSNIAVAPRDVDKSIGYFSFSKSYSPYKDLEMRSSHISNIFGTNTSIVFDMSDFRSWGYCFGDYFYLKFKDEQ